MAEQQELKSTQDLLAMYPDLPLDRVRAKEMLNELSFLRLAREAMSPDKTSIPLLLADAGPCAAREFLELYVPAVTGVPVTAN
jgi:hypothetical protein